MTSPGRTLALLILLISLKLTPQCAVLAGALGGCSFLVFNLPAPVTSFSVWLAKDFNAMATALLECNWHGSPVLPLPYNHVWGAAEVGMERIRAERPQERTTEVWDEGRGQMGKWDCEVSTAVESGKDVGQTPLCPKLLFSEHIFPGHAAARLPVGILLFLVPGLYIKASTQLWSQGSCISLSHQRYRAEAAAPAATETRAWMLGADGTPGNHKLSQQSTFLLPSLSSADRRGCRNSTARAIQKPGFLPAVSIFTLALRASRGGTVDPSTKHSTKLARNSSREQHQRLWGIEISLIRLPKSKLILLVRMTLSPCWCRFRQARSDSGCKLTFHEWKVLGSPPLTSQAESVQTLANSLCCDWDSKFQPSTPLLPSAEHTSVQPCLPDSSTFQFFRDCSYCLWRLLLSQFVPGDLLHVSKSCLVFLSLCGTCPGKPVTYRQHQTW